MFDRLRPRIYLVHFPETPSIERYDNRYIDTDPPDT